MRTVRHARGAIRVFGSRNDSNARDAARTPITTAIPIMVPFASPTPLADLAMMDINRESALTAAMPLTRFSVLTMPRSTETPARIPTATDIARSVAPALTICPPPATWVNFTIATTIAPRAAIPREALTILETSIPPISLIATARMPIAPAMDNNEVPIFDMSTFAYDDSPISAANINPIRPITVSAFWTSPVSIPPIILSDAVRRSIATPRLRAIEPILSICLDFPANCETIINAEKIKPIIPTTATACLT